MPSQEPVREGGKALQRGRGEQYKSAFRTKVKVAFKRLHLGCRQAKFVPISLQTASHVELETQMEAFFGSGQEHADVGLSSLPLQAELAVLLSTKIGRIQARKAAVELADLQPHLGGHGIQLLTEAVDDGSPNRAGFCH